MEEQLSSVDVPRILGLGALNVDYIFSVDEFVIDGETSIREFHKSPGGSALNTITILAQLGIKAGLFGVVGDDADGDLLLEKINRKGVISNVKRLKGETGKAFILVDRSGRRSIYVMPGVNTHLSSIDYPLLLHTWPEWIHVTSLVGEDAFLKQADYVLSLPQRIRLSFSPGMLYVRYGLKRLESLIKRTDVLFLNKEEIYLLMGERGPFATNSIKNLIQRLHDLGPKYVAVTLGGDGAIMSDGKEVVKEPSMAVDVIDTTGAGDAFSAGVLYGILRGLDLRKTLILGNLLASKVVRIWGSEIELREEEIQGLIL